MRHLSRIALVTVLIVAAAMAAACGKSNPAAPTAPTSSPSGATIQGTVLGGSVSARSADSTGGGMTVTVVGTNITVSVSLTGQFTITGVPAGDIQLKFHGVSGDATITVSQVAQGDTITLTVTITGTTATAETETRTDQSGMMQVEGRIEAIDTTAKTITVAGKVISYANATMRHGSTVYPSLDQTCVGWRVHVAGTPAANGVTANTIEIQNTNGQIQVTVNGVVSGYKVTDQVKQEFEFTVSGRLIKANASTSYTGKTTAADVKDGARVEVKGQQMNGFVLATSIHAN